VACELGKRAKKDDKKSPTKGIQDRQTLKTKVFSVTMRQACGNTRLI
jgi:hypothetical protein